MSVIITWLSKLFHALGPRRRQTLSYFVIQPGIGLFWSCPLPITGGASSAGRPTLEDPSVLAAALWNIPTLSWLNKSLASALPTWLQFWTFPTEGSVETQVPPRLSRTNRWEPQWLFWGLTRLSTYVLPGCKVLKFSVQFVRTFALCHPMLYLGSLFVFKCPVFIEPYSLRRQIIGGNFKTKFSKDLGGLKYIFKPPTHMTVLGIIMIIIPSQIMLFFLRQKDT